MKEKPSYFQVKEIIKLDFDEKGLYSYIKLKKKNLNTITALKIMANKLNISLKQIGYAGNKDKKAITTQYISVPRTTQEKINKLQIKNINLTFVGFGNKRINLGSSLGNKFKIKFKDKIKKVSFCENYFDDQRFGVNKNNHIFGKLILENKLPELKKLIELPSETRELNILLRFYINSYQSYLFNLGLSEYLKKFKHKKVSYSLGELVFIDKKIKNFKIPLISFDTVFKGDIGKIYKKILLKEKINLSYFITKSNPFLISDTQYRDAFFEVKDLKQKDDFIYFSLSKGSYATILLKKLENT